MHREVPERSRTPVPHNPTIGGTRFGSSALRHRLQRFDRGRVIRVYIAWHVLPTVSVHAEKQFRVTELRVNIVAVIK